jgi:hypothetical protein
MDGIQLAQTLATQGYQIKNKTRTSITVLVDGNRLDKMSKLASELNHLGSKIDKTLKGSSIGGVVVGTVKIYIKSVGRTGGLDVEEAAISTLQDSIMSAMALVGGPINVRLKDRTVKDIVGVKKTPGTPKSDFHLIDKGGRPVVHISHKKGSTPRDFQQWGGITESAIASHKEVQLFESKVNELYPGGVMPNGESAFMKITDNHLKMMAVYGVHYNRGGVDANRVDVLIQGDPGLKQSSDGTFSITATGNLHYLGDKLAGGFEPVLAIIYKGDRTQLGLRGGRASIYPIGGRIFKREVKAK